MLASDGVWEFISNEQALKIVFRYKILGGIEHACDKIIEKSSFKWVEMDENMDDITAVILYFKRDEEVATTNILN